MNINFPSVFKKIIRDPLLLALSLLVIAVGILLSVTAFTQQPELKDGATAAVRIDQARVEAKVAASAEARTKGLSGTDSLGKDEGLLFVSNPKEIPGIVMRDMNYPIDIIWINQGTVSEVTPDVQPQPGTSEGQLTVYRPAGPADQVLEVNAGWAAANGVQPGDPVRITSL